MRHAVVLRTPSVRYADLAKGLEGVGTSWGAARHVAATSSLASAIRRRGHPASSAAAVLDLTWSSDVRREKLVSEWPDIGLLSSRDDYDEGLKQVANLVRGMRMQDSLLFDDRLRLWVDSLGDAVERRRARVLVHARRELARTISTLVQAGLRPAAQDVVPSTSLGLLAMSAWARLEHDVTELARPREMLWTSPNDRSARDGVVREALRVTTGYRPGDVVVNHGFYFYTPPQWRFFQLLDEMAVRQVFVVHDDGRSRAYETWRRYFTGTLGFALRDTAEPGETAESLLDLALTGREVLQPQGATDVSITRYRSPADMAVRLSRLEEGTEGGRLFAADQPTVERWLQRLHGSASTGRVDLGTLPVGAFLRGLYGSIAEDPDGSIGIDLDVTRLVDVLAADVLDGAGRDEAVLLRQCRQYFEGARSLETWMRRVTQLEVLATDAPAGLVKSDAATDADRIRAAVANPFRSAPWLDLTPGEATRLRTAVQSVLRLLESIAESGRKPLREHWKVLDAQLTEKIRALDETTAEDVITRLYGFRIGAEETEVGVQSVADVVAIILAGPAAPPLDGDDPTFGQSGRVKDLRALDALGLAPVDGPLHVLNLADGSFPRRGPGVGWPFSLEEVAPNGAERLLVKDLIALRQETGALSDLYLLSLALEGVTSGHPIDLSWVERVGGEDLSMSPFLALVAELDLRLPEELRRRVGGVPVGLKSLETDRSGAPVHELPEPRAGSEGADLTGLDRVAAAAGAVCPRRFALQWVLSRSNAWQARHHQAMLYANAPAAAARLHPDEVEISVARTVADEAWVWLSAAERASSRAKAVVQDPGKNYSARPVWVHFLQGKQNSDDHKDLPYASAVGQAPPSAARLFDLHTGWLPPGVGPDDAEQCDFCPVRAVCSVAQRA